MTAIDSLEQLSENSDETDEQFIEELIPSDIANNRERNPSNRLIGTILDLTIVIFLLLSILYSVVPSRFLHPPAQFQCPRTTIYPFDVGCPYNCSAIRPGLPGPFYKMSIFWVFGSLKGFRNATEIPPGAFRGQTTLVNTFLDLESQSRKLVNKQVGRAGFSELDEHLQSRIHVSLSYFCCWTKEEGAKAGEIMSKWNETQKFEFKVRFDRLRCFHERNESVTVIFEVDNESERKFMRINHALNGVLRKEGLKIWVPRERQMRFHTTILGFRTKDGTSIEKYLKGIWSSVRQVDHASVQTTIAFNPQLGSLGLSRGTQPF